MHYKYILLMFYRCILITTILNIINFKKVTLCMYPNATRLTPDSSSIICPQRMHIPPMIPGCGHTFFFGDDPAPEQCNIKNILQEC